LAAVEPKPGLLRLFTVTGVALLLQQRLNIFDEIDFPVRGWREFGVGHSQRHHEDKQRKAHIPSSDCLEAQAVGIMTQK